MPPKAPGVAALASKFGGAPQCMACGKSCYLNEQVKHNEKVFHEVCFCCKVCSMRIVPVGQATEYQAQIYHKSCLSKVLKPPLLSPPGAASPSARTPSDDGGIPPPRSPHFGPTHESPAKPGPPARPPPSPPGLDTRRDPSPSPVPRSDVTHAVTPRSPIVAARTLEFSLRSNGDDPRTRELQSKVNDLEGQLERERAKNRALEQSIVKVTASPTPASSVEPDQARGFAAALEAVRVENSQLRASLESAQQSAERSRTEVTALGGVVSKLEAEQSRLHKELDAVKKELKAKTTEYDEKITENQKQTTSMGALSSELQLRTSKLEKTTAENLVLQEDLKVFEAEITHLTEQNQELEKQLHTLQVEKQEQTQKAAREKRASVGGPAPPPPVKVVSADPPSVDSKLLRELVQGVTFTSYRVDSEHPDAQATKEEVLVFYEPNGAPEGHKGWICWNEGGVRQMSPLHRIAVNPYTQLATKNGRSPFRASQAQPQCCFSILGADEDNVLDVEAESETIVSRWMEGLKFLLRSSRTEIFALLGVGQDNETLEQKQRMEELQKLEMDLMQEVEQLKTRKQALLDAEPVDDSDTY